MNLWLAVGAVVVLVLIVGIVVVTRPSHAEDRLRQPERVSRPAGTAGSFDTSALRDWLLSAIAERRTGMLQLTAGGQTCSLYFLFGHLFHAASDTLTGEPALQECLTWQDIHYTFNSKAKLPTDETIERPTAEILA